MLKLFKEKLCVDTTRIFCCGFSYGAMVSYSLSLDFAKQLRAVATYAPANWNIWLPTNTHDPIAYYQTTGTSDDLCKWVNSDARKEGGKYCVLQHIEDNGCTAPATIPTATSGKHVSTEFSGCNAGYPVKFGSHNGGHQGTASDAGSSVNWIAAETWEFFMRF
jgi:poly(3-hydroxybutyrate) depolymerase